MHYFTILLLRFILAPYLDRGASCNPEIQLLFSMSECVHACVCVIDGVIREGLNPFISALVYRDWEGGSACGAHG